MNRPNHDYQIDVPKEQLIEHMDQMIKLGYTCYVKWTCPGCGERAQSDTPNSFHIGGYRHAECGTLYKGNRYGFMAMILMDPNEGENDAARN